MTAKPLPARMSVDEVIGAFEAIDNRAELVAFLAPLRMPDGLDEDDRARLTSALVAAATRVWKGRFAA